MSPASERPFPTKKSLRIWVRNNGHVQRKQRVAYVYPRTVEAAKDPFICCSGKNKMFFLIAINLYPDSKIIKPDDSESETETKDLVENGMDEETSKLSPTTDLPQLLKPKSPRKYKKRQAQTENSIMTMTDVEGSLNNCEQMFDPADTLLMKSTDETISQSQQINKFTPVKSLIAKAKYNLERAKRRHNNMAIKKVAKKKSCESKTNCSEVLINDDSSLSPCNSSSSCSSPSGVNKGVKKTSRPSSRQCSPQAIPNIMNSLQKVIQNCSESGLISFNLSKQPRQSRA